ncbi:MAG: diaminopimelate epimerase [Bacteroidota bacterium]
MELNFHKYHGAGNDFVLLDDRETNWADRLDQPTIAALCARHFGVGADGLMLLREHPEFDFEMVYFNADGAPSSMCGNGGRCIVRFAHDLGLVREEYRFLAVDGPHRARLLPNGDVALEMHDVREIQQPASDVFVLDTGSPHYVTNAHDPATVDVKTVGRTIRNSTPYRVEGINVNFIRPTKDGLQIATYERGVEDETLACGTGVTAAAIVAMKMRGIAEGESFRLPVEAKGGALAVTGQLINDTFTDLWLEGPAQFVFRGQWIAYQVAR